MKRNCVNCIHWSRCSPDTDFGECGGIPRNPEDQIYAHQPAAIVTNDGQRGVLFTRARFVCQLHQLQREDYPGQADEARPFGGARHVES